MLKMLKAYNGEFAVQSFNPYSLEYFRKHEPDILRGQLSMANPGGLSYFKRKALGHLKIDRISAPHFISYHFADLPNKYVSQKELPVFAWTVRSNTDYEKVRNCCDNIIFEGFTPESK